MIWQDKIRRRSVTDASTISLSAPCVRKAHRWNGCRAPMNWANVVIATSTLVSLHLLPRVHCSNRGRRWTGNGRTAAGTRHTSVVIKNHPPLNKSTLTQPQTLRLSFKTHMLNVKLSFCTLWCTNLTVTPHHSSITQVKQQLAQQVDIPSDVCARHLLTAAEHVNVSLRSVIVSMGSHTVNEWLTCSLLKQHKATVCAGWKAGRRVSS